MSGLNIFHMKIQVECLYSERRQRRDFFLLTHIAYVSMDYARNVGRNYELMKSNLHNCSIFLNTHGNLINLLDIKINYANTIYFSKMHIFLCEKISVNTKI